MIDEFQPLRDELAQVAQELNAESIEQVVYAWILRLPSQPLPIIGSGKLSACVLHWWLKS
jgi:predicted oxidoreductase